LLITSYPFKSNISCLSNQNLNKFNYRYKEIKIYKGDGRKMSFKINEFDYVISTATIEHVGSFKNQINFVKECFRVSKKKLFITTPNRFFPIDFHTRLPFIHWLPKHVHRKILTILNENFLNLEKNLNLLCKKSLIKICKRINIQNYKIYSIKTFGLTSNLVLIISKSKM
jgi:ubiquinone/menaquinone biosynthesis C-methylase UbiE